MATVWIKELRIPQTFMVVVDIYFVEQVTHHVPPPIGSLQTAPESVIETEISK